MKIHSLLILNSTGTCLYSKNFTKEFQNLDINLITPFFSALFSFAENTLSRKLEELEMGGLRLLFKIEEEFVFILFTDASVSLLFAKTRIEKIKESFHRIYDELEDELKGYQEIESQELDSLVAAIITGAEEIFKSQSFYEKVIGMFKNLVFENEILGAALLSTKGNIIYSSLPDDILLGAVKELEIRFMTGALNLPEMYYSLENRQKVFSKIIEHKKSGLHLFLVIMFESSVPLGMATIKLDSITKQMITLLKIYGYK